MKKRISIFFLILTFVFFSSAFAQEMFESEETAKVDNEKEDIRSCGVCFLNSGINLTLNNGARSTYQRVDDAKWNDDDNNLDGTKVDSREDLGLDRFDTSYYLGGILRWNGFRFKVDFSDATFDGDRQIERNVTIDGTTYGIGTQLDSEIEIAWWRFLIGHTLFSNEYVGFGIDLRVDYLKFCYDFEGEATTGQRIKESDDKAIAYPMIGFHLDFAITDNLVCTLNFNGLYFKQSSVKVYGAFVSLMPRWYIKEDKSIFLSAEVGYEFNRIEADRDSFEGNVELNSWFASAGLGVAFF